MYKKAWLGFSYLSYFFKHLSTKIIEAYTKWDPRVQFVNTKLT